MNRKTDLFGMPSRVLITLGFVIMLVGCGVTQSGERLAAPQTLEAGIPTAQPTPPRTQASTPIDKPTQPTPIVEFLTPETLPEPPGQLPTLEAGAPGTLALVGYYDAQDQSAAAVEFRRRIARFERATGTKVVYEGRPRQDVSKIVKVYLTAGRPLDLGPLLPEDIAELVDVNILARLDDLAPNQRWPQAGPADQACLIDGRRYCIVDEQGMAWIVAKNAPNPTGAAQMLKSLFGKE
jgi:hypothetical protein